LYVELFLKMNLFYTLIYKTSRMVDNRAYINVEFLTQNYSYNKV